MSERLRPPNLGGNVLSRAVPLTAEVHIVQPLTVFVVDDHEMVRNALAAFLHISGFQVKTFASADECVRDLGKERTDCILSDLDMPGMNGAQFAEELTRLRCDVPIAILTSHPMEHPLVARARAAGVRAVLSKDFADGQLKDVLHALTAMAMRSPETSQSTQGRTALDLTASSVAADR